MSFNNWWEADQDNVKFIFVLTAAFQIWLFCWLALDVNATSIHGLYRDRLASAYLVGKNTDKKEVDIEEDINLFEICRYEARFCRQRMLRSPGLQKFLLILKIIISYCKFSIEPHFEYS